MKNDEIKNALKELINEGELLAPYAGNMMDGYNSERQSRYVSWRLQALSVIQELGASAKYMLKEIESDEQGPWFYKSSTQRILGALNSAFAISSRDTSISDASDIRSASGPS